MTRRTLGWVVAAALSVALVHADPWRDQGIEAPFVSTQSAARRVFPVLAESGAATPVTVTLAPRGQPEITLASTPTGARVVVGGEDVGPADPEGLEGLLASLRMATTLRAVSSDAEAQGPARGTVTVRRGDLVAALELHDASPDRAGSYAILDEPGGVSAWVVEDELGQLLQLSPEAWLMRRLVPWPVTRVVRVAFGPDHVLTRGEDGLWRHPGPEGPLLLHPYAVEARLDRLLAARVQPFMPHARDDAAFAPAVELENDEGEVLVLRTAGGCGGTEARVLVDRGPGWPGCVAADLLAPWPAAWADAIEPRLVPYDLQRVLRIEQVQPRDVVLRRHEGDWRLVDGATIHPVADAEVRRWYATLHDAEVQLTDAPMPPPELEWRVVTDTSVTLALACGRAEAQWHCRRDGGPVHRVRTPELALSLDAADFETRALLSLMPDEVLAVELTEHEAGASLRQSAHLDLGVWRLDAPEHPDGDAALSELALEDLLAALGSLRVESWTAIPGTTPERELRFELRPRHGRPSHVELALHPDCIVVHDGRAGRVDATACDRLTTDLLHADPLAHWLRHAQSLEVEPVDGTATSRWVRRGEVLEPEGVTAAVPLERWSAVTQARAVPGAPVTAAQWRLRVRPSRGPVFEVEVGEDWAQLRGAGWRYRWNPEPSTD